MIKMSSASHPYLSIVKCFGDEFSNIRVHPMLVIQEFEVLFRKLLFMDAVNNELEERGFERMCNFTDLEV